MNCILSIVGKIFLFLLKVLGNFHSQTAETFQGWVNFSYVSTHGTLKTGLTQNPVHIHCNNILTRWTF